MKHYDVAIIGAGFGGLSAALTLAEQGAKVALFEALVYPGGCASTFKRKGYRFESGATLFSGFGEGQLFRRWIERYDMDVKFQPIDPVVTLRTPDFSLAIPRHRQLFIDRICALDNAPVDELRRFFDWQHKVADALWELFDDESLLPPLTATSLARHLMRSPRYLPLVTIIGRSLGDVLRRRNLWDFLPLRTYLDAVCQITVQTSADEAEASFALASMDYFFRGTGHIHGGIGQLATAISDAIVDLGGQVHYADPVWKIRSHDRGWTLETRRRQITCDKVIANNLPCDLATMITDADYDRDLVTNLSDQIKTGWGAAMLYMGLDAQKIDAPQAHHLELVADTAKPLIAGNHLFCSIGGGDEVHRAPEGQRVATVSTHVDMDKLWDSKASDEDRGAYIDAIHARMRQTLHSLAPELVAAVEFEMTASPRTFQRFTSRHRGYVGGIPRRRGLHNYWHFGAPEIAPNIYLVGDTIFPGQSTLAVALGALRLAQTIG